MSMRVTVGDALSLTVKHLVLTYSYHAPPHKPKQMFLICNDIKKFNGVFRSTVYVKQY